MNELKRCLIYIYVYTKVGREIVLSHNVYYVYKLYKNTETSILILLLLLLLLVFILTLNFRQSFYKSSALD